MNENSACSIRPVHWTPEEITLVARHFEALFPGHEPTPRLLRVAQGALPADRQRRSLNHGPGVLALVRGIETLRNTPTQSATEAQGPTLLTAILEAPALDRPQPTQPPEPNDSRLLPRIIGTDEGALESCSILLIRINTLAANLGQIPGGALDGITKHPVDFNRLRALTISAADLLSRFEQSLTIAHNR